MQDGPAASARITESGKQAMRAKLASRKAARDVTAIRALREQLRLGPPTNA